MPGFLLLLYLAPSAPVFLPIALLANHTLAILFVKYLNFNAKPIKQKQSEIKSNDTLICCRINQKK